MPTCAKCNEEITDSVLTAEDQTWHVKCFSCAICDKSFVEDGGSDYVKLADGRCVCDSCKEGEDTANNGTCKGCGKAIAGEVLTCEGAQWHRECFKCEVCEKPILKEGSNTIQLSKTSNGKRACVDCGGGASPTKDAAAPTPTLSKAKTMGECGKCGKVIEDQAVNAEGMSFHVECLTCDMCEKQLKQEGSDQVDYANGSDGKRYCPACQQKLMSTGATEDAVRSCGKCGKEFPGTGEAFVDSDGKTLCPACSPVGTACAKCGKPISAEDFKAGAKRQGDGYFHVECYEKAHASEWSLADLKDESKWKAANIKSTEREQYLNNAEFEQVFEMKKEDFDKLPKFKRDVKKKNAGLF